MRTQIPGFHEAADDDLLMVIFCDRDEDGATYVHTLYSPTRQELENAIKQHNLPMGYTLRVIMGRNPKAHTVLFELPKFEEHLKEMGLKS